MSDLKKKLDKMHTLHKVKEIIELIIVLALTPFIIYLAWDSAATGVYIGAGIILAGFAIILTKSAKVRRVAKRKKENTSLKEYLQAEKMHVENRVAMWKTAWAWFYTPLAIGFSTLVISHPDFSSTFKIFGPTGVLLYCTFLAFVVGGKFIKSQLHPLFADIDAMLDELAEDGG